MSPVEYSRHMTRHRQNSVINQDGKDKLLTTSKKHSVINKEQRPLVG